jgi:hypothetical protein
MDNQSCVVIEVQATAARLAQESVAAREMITRLADKRGGFPKSLAADAGYGTGEFLAWLEERGVTSYIPLRGYTVPKKKEPLYGIERFTYRPDANSYSCPEGKELKYIGIKLANRSHIYRANEKKCCGCPQKSRCTSGRYRQIVVNVNESARQDPVPLDSVTEQRNQSAVDQAPRAPQKSSARRT